MPSNRIIIDTVNMQKTEWIARSAEYEYQEHKDQLFSDVTMQKIFRFYFYN